MQPAPDRRPPIFSSAREKRLWTWTAVAVVGIYATLGLTASIARMIPDWLAAVAFVLGMLLVAATVLTEGLRVRPGGAEIGIALGVGVVYYMVALRMTIPERSHLIEYGVVAVLVYEALRERRGQGRRVPMPALAAIAATSAIGAIDEGIQYFLPSRVFDPVDIFFNFMAATMAVAGMTALAAARRWRERRRDR